MKIGLVGFPSAGKTTVFNALTGLAAATGSSAARGKTNLGTVKVPDARVDALAALFKPKKTVYAEVVFSDVAAGMGAGGARSLDRNVLNAMREVDALCQVARAYDDAALPEPADPVQEVIDLEAELVLADLELVEKRLERLKKEKGKANPREEPALQRIKDHLDQNLPLRLLDLPPEDWALFVSLKFLSRKPFLIVLNRDEATVAAPPPDAIARHAAERRIALVTLSAQVEEEIARMAPEDQREFLSSMGLSESAKDRFIRAAFGLLDLISFLTAGEDECRAWPIERGLTAHKAAGKIHSDIERGFIRAEVVRWDDLVSFKSEARCREAGKLRLEGKEYVVQDGDVVNFRFNV